MSDIVLGFKEIEKILLCFLPGYIFLVATNYFFQRGKPKARFLIANSIAISAIVFAFISMIGVTEITYGLIFVTSTVLVIVAYILASCAKSRWFSNLSVTLFQRTPETDFWNDVFDRNGTKITIIRDEKIITGYIHKIEESASERWVQLSDYEIKIKGNIRDEMGSDNEELAVKIGVHDVVILTYLPGSSYKLPPTL